ncbi:hypothetical protein NA57DRAFT_43802 [Rhizodiscina lignyota]|uniref:Uncharacterized protein n=1 Tax=Rhizodiscina lignyota TaxID=1504668 RepID=A0A9P4M3N9_9PEZI|nr:hypothetical protein NA57DRAFT_43802 [Rhizodiscina lignyota]
MLRYSHQDCCVQYIDEVDEPKFNQEILTRHLERCVTASNPWQTWFMGLRRLYQWEEPNKTAAWFGTWALIWYSNRVVSFIMFWAIFIVIRNRLNSSSHQSLKESHERALDRTAGAFKFGEFVNRHGQGKWLDQMIEQCGPMLQMQIGDIADHLEIMTNFYEWKNPRMTMCTLFLLCTMGAVGNLTSTDWAMRIINMLIILYFFLGRPIASLHPKYRHLVNPIKWFFWDIPTHAEWSFQYLRDNARKIYNERMRQSIDWARVADEDKQHGLVDAEDVDVCAFSCTWHGIPGNLVLTVSGLRFNRSMPAKCLWSHSYFELREMRKLDRGILKSITKMKRPKALEVIISDGSCILLEGMKMRDQAFNMIIGFSGLRWKQLAFTSPDRECECQNGAACEEQASTKGQVGSEDDLEDEFYDAQ